MIDSTRREPGTRGHRYTGLVLDLERARHFKSAGNPGTPAPPPPAPSKTDPDAEDAAAKARMRLRARRGRASTILGDPSASVMGAQAADAGVQRPTLLGGGG